MECVRLRAKDVDFEMQQITVRDGKGFKDRVTMLPKSLAEALIKHIERVKMMHNEDLAAGYGETYLPFALARKYPNAGRAWGWQYMFPARSVSVDPRSGVTRRHHVDEKALQRAMKQAVRDAGLTKLAMPG